MEIKKVGVVGCGLMGSGIAEVAAKAGFPVVVREVNDELLQKGRSRIEASLSRAVEKGKAAPQDKVAALGRITGTTQLSDLSDCDLVIEAVGNITTSRIKFAANRSLEAVAGLDADGGVAGLDIAIVDVLRGHQ